MLLRNTDLPLEINENIGKETLVRCPVADANTLDVDGIVTGVKDCDEIVVYVAGIKKDPVKYKTFVLDQASLLGKANETRGRKKKESDK